MCVLLSQVRSRLYTRPTGPNKTRGRTVGRTTPSRPSAAGPFSCVKQERSGSAEPPRNPGGHRIRLEAIASTVGSSTEPPPQKKQADWGRTYRSSSSIGAAVVGWNSEDQVRWFRALKSAEIKVAEAGLLQKMLLILIMSYPSNTANWTTTIICRT